MFQTKAVEKIKTHILCSISLFMKILPFMRSCGKVLICSSGGYVDSIMHPFDILPPSVFGFQMLKI